MATAALVLAAGEGKRMKSDLPKVAHAILGEPMVRLVIHNARLAGCERVVVVTGHGADAVEALLPGDVDVARQHEQRGTGHAVMSAEDVLIGVSGSLLVLSGDSPLLTPETLRRLVDVREETGAAAVLLTARPADPTGYGRIVRADDGSVGEIVEQKDLAPGQELIAEVNTGTYCFDTAALFDHLHKLECENAQGEFYLTDMVAVFRAEGLKVVDVTTDDPQETLGVNSRVQLAEAAKVLQRRVNETHMLAGVTMTDPDLVWIGPHVSLGRDVVVEPMSFILGACEVGDCARIGPDTRLTDCVVGEKAVVDSSIGVEARIGAETNVGPRAYLRPGTVLERGAKAGTSVEIKNSVIGEGAKVPHLSYIGDATVGRDVNVGAGTITCNYDGKRKHRTVIGDGAFIGSDTMLVAPVSIGAGAVTGAGSAIAKDVPDGALGIERTEQANVEGWALRRAEASDE